MAQSLVKSATDGRVNTLVPAAIAAAGLIIAVLESRVVGIGIAVGACLAYVNSVLLSRRVDIAADSGNIASAFMVMQIGLMITFVVVGIATVVLVKISVTMAVAEAAGFGVTQLAILAMFYRARGRVQPSLESNAS